MSAGPDEAPIPTPFKTPSLLVVEPHTVSIVLSLHQQFRGHINFWHDQVYKAATWSILPAYALVALYVDPERLVDRANPETWWIVLLLIVFVGMVSGLYLQRCQKAYTGNWEQITNCERALRLQEPGVYFRTSTFLDNKQVTYESAEQALLDFERHEGMHAKDIEIIRLAHFLAILAAVGVMVALRVASK